MEESKPASQSSSSPAAESETNRRDFLSSCSGAAMAFGLVGSYGTLVAMAGRFLYPANPDPKAWIYLAHVDEVPPGQSLEFKTPLGSPVVVARLGKGDHVEDYIALSSVCPHLGCQVFWEPQNDRFFCPCHNGTFDRTGKATGGPPAKANQNLVRFPLRLEGGSLFIQVPLVGPTQSLVGRSRRHEPGEV